MAHVGVNDPGDRRLLVLFSSTNIYVTIAGALFMVMFHTFIILIVPAGSAAGMERLVRIRQRVSLFIG